MGYDVARFKAAVNEDFICPICACVLEDAVMTRHCEHAFCRSCIIKWLITKRQCPIDNSFLHVSELSALPRMIKNMLQELEISCDHANNGCTLFVTLETLPSHIKQCEYNPKLRALCPKKCGMMVLKSEMEAHNCLKELRKTIDEMKNENQAMRRLHAKVLESTTCAASRHFKKLSMELKIAQKHNSKFKKELFVLKRRVAFMQNKLLNPNNKWWQNLDIMLGELYTPLLSQGSLMANFGEFLKRYDCPVSDWHNYEICKCSRGDDHDCGIEYLKELQLTFRWSSCMNIWLILKEENPHIPKELIPKSGFALYFKAS